MFLAYERPVPWGWASLDMPAYCGDVNELRDGFTPLINSLQLTTKYRAQAQALYIFTFLMADPVYVYRADKLCRHLDSIPGPLDPELSPLPMSPRRLHG